MMPAKSRQFSMPTLRARAKKMMRKKHKKTVNLTLLDKVWKEYVEYAITRPLLKYGKIQVDEKLSFEIVGRKVEDDPRLRAMLINGMAVTKKGFKTEAKILNRNRHGILYKIVAEDNNLKEGVLIFEADKKLKKRVKEQLINTTQYYRIAQ